jgi:multidrug transporter EmrE-like cation transporter
MHLSRGQRNIMLKTPLASILFMLAAAVLGAAGQYLIKAGTDRAAPGIAALLFSPWLWLGIACYTGVMFMFTQAFRHGGAVTVLYPVYSSTFIWAAALGWLVYQQPIRPIHVLGMALLIAGMYFMGIGNESAREGPRSSPRAMLTRHDDMETGRE